MKADKHDQRTGQFRKQFCGQTTQTGKRIKRDVSERADIIFEPGLRFASPQRRQRQRIKCRARSLARRSPLAMIAFVLWSLWLDLLKRV